MNARALNKLHDSGQKDLFSVADGINLNLLAKEVFVNEDGFVLINLNGGFEILAQHFFVCNNLHCSSAENKARPHKHRIAYLLGNPYARFNVRDCLALRVRYFERLDNIIERVAVFRLFNGGAVGADYLHSPCGKRLGKVDRRLTAEGCNNALGLFKQNNVHHVLRRERLKVKLIRGGIIG